MAASIDYNQAFQLADRFEEYRVIKSWGIMVIVTGISIALYRHCFDLYHWLTVSFQQDNEQTLITFMTLFNLFAVSFLIFPLILAVTTYIAIKRTTVEDHEISSKRYILYGITLGTFYFNIFMMLVIFMPYIEILFFLQNIFIEDNTRINVSSSIQMDVGYLIFGGFSCLISYLLLTRVVKRTKFKELLVPGAILILFSLISIFLGSIIPPPSSRSFPRTLVVSMSWVNTIIIVASFVGSGLYSIRKAYRILEGRK